MCSRIIFDASEVDIDAEYNVDVADESLGRKAKKDGRITDEEWVITADEPQKRQLMHFGLVRWDAPECKMQGSTFNAKKENLLVIPLWSVLMTNHKRCIILVTEFVEPEAIDADRTKHWAFHLKSRKVFSVAGLWSEWIDPKTGSVYRSFAMITGEANQQVAEVHTKNRMPVALTKEQEAQWLSKALPDMDAYIDVLKFIPDEEMDRNQTHKPGANDDESQLNLF
ncbi:putative SOS response-associated peptidase YedK [Mucilaginibacter sp. UYP25]|uniref:SOS response-associated peptidase n=1 Tax=unclassified Mucilaginibacter TaxID=2617802 RepID=UPI003391262B